jgi:cation diffusion facilitator CzcD-associated flavoprotein CzcO
MVSLRARTVAIVGGGPSGIVAAKYLRAEKAFDKIVVFEQKSRGGGMWNYTGDLRDEDLFTVPQTNARGKNQNPVWREPENKEQNGHQTNGHNGVDKEASFLTPIYERLETNIPRGLMGFQDLDWPQDSQLFPTHETTRAYIDEYGRDVQDLVEYETQVVDVQAAGDDYTGGWRVRVRDLRSNKEREDLYDAVIVANGHFVVPYVPDIPGIREWNERYPAAISHSKYYRKPEDFAGKKVVVVGNSASGVDISTQIAAFSKLPLLWSNKLISPLKSSDSNKTLHLPITRFIPSTRGVEFEDGTIESDIDAVVFATGYFYSLPFLEKVEPALITDGSHVNHTYQHVFYTPRPTLSFLALNQRVIPFPLAEAQASVLARVYAGRLSLPPLTEMRKWEEEMIAENGDGKSFHLLPFPKDCKYINMMTAWANTASPRDGLENDGKGKLGPVWGDWEFWCRENFLAIRAKFGAQGEKRRFVRSIGELGFSFEEHMEQKAKEEGEMI